MNCPAFHRRFPNEESLIQYIDQNQDLTIIKGYCSLLIFACKKKYETAALKLLDHSPEDIKLTQVHNGSTALMIACKNGLIDVVNRILDFKSDDILINKTDNNGDSAFAIICSSKTPIDKDDRTKLCYKILDNHLDGLYLYSPNKQGNTALMLACETELEDVIMNVLYDINPVMLNLGATNRKDEEILHLAYVNGLWDEAFPKLRDILNEQNGHVGNLPKLPTYDKQMIDLNTTVYDVIEMQEYIIQDYIKNDPGNIVIKVGDKMYLSNREYIKRQASSAFVFECKVANIKRPDNITANLPLYNLKMIGVDVPTDQVGIIPEYIFFNTASENTENGMEYVINSNEQLFSIIPVYDRMLVSVISANEFGQIGSGFSGVGSVHCQAGQGGLSGMIVKAYSGETVVREPQTRRNTRRSTTRGRRPRNRNTRSRSSS